MLTRLYKIDTIQGGLQRRDMQCFGRVTEGISYLEKLNLDGG